MKEVKWKLYIDDLRTPVDDSFIVARNMKEAKSLIKKYGVPYFISFDHDLGIDENGNLLPTGYDFAKWLVEMDMDDIIKLPKNFNFTVHSQNPVGAKNIRVYLRNYMDLK